MWPNLQFPADLKTKWTWWMQVMEIYIKGLVLDLDREGPKSFI